MSVLREGATQAGRSQAQPEPQGKLNACTQLTPPSEAVLSPGLDSTHPG